MKQNFEKKEKSPCRFLLSCFLPICIHIIYPVVIIWPSFYFSLLNLLFINLKSPAIHSCLADILLCVNPKCIFQASRATVRSSGDPVSLSSVHPAPSTVPATEEPLSLCMLNELTRICSYAGREGMVGVPLGCAHTRSHGMQIRMFSPHPWALTQSPLVPFVSKQQGIQAENSLLTLQ